MRITNKRYPAKNNYSGRRSSPGHRNAPPPGPQNDWLKPMMSALSAIMAERTYADRAVEKTLRANKDWNDDKRLFFSETVYDIVRTWRLLCEALDEKNYLDEKICSDERFLRVLIGAWHMLRNKAVPEEINIPADKIQKIQKNFSQLKQTRAVRESIPDWLDALGEAELGADWENTLHALNQPPRVFIRINRLKTGKFPLMKKLLDERIITDEVEGLEDAVVLRERKNIFRSEAFREGLFEVQDAASQLVTEFLEVQPGMRVVDACAGAGGKTMHIASLMNNRGRIIAMDTEEWKLAELRKRAARSGAQNIETRLVDSTKVLKRMKESAERLLLDVPCSGLGVLRRNPDAKWKVSPEMLERVKKIQREILESYSRLCAPGGLMVYSTCSILPSEGEEQILAFLDKHSSTFELIDEKRVSPETGFDGFYMAKLRRRENPATTPEE